MGMKLNFFFRWFDIWMGLYIDRKNKAVYICPVPMLGIKISWEQNSGPWKTSPTPYLREIMDPTNPHPEYSRWDVHYDNGSGKALCGHLAPPVLTEVYDHVGCVLCRIRHGDEIKRQHIMGDR